VDFRTLGPRRRKPIGFTLDTSTHRVLEYLAGELGVSRSRVIDLLIQRMAIRTGWMKPEDLCEYTKRDQKRLEAWYRQTMIRLRKQAKDAARRPKTRHAGAERQ
jgi:hypothetical protein